MKWYSLDNLLKLDCQYSIAMGKRSNGKSFSGKIYGLEDYVNTGRQTAIIRRWDEDYLKQRAATMMADLVCDGEGRNRVDELTGGKWNTIVYQSRRWYLARWDDEKNEMIKDKEPFAFAFSLSAMEHDKSTSYPNVYTIIFDEFATRGMYLHDEFIIFMNVLSTIIRHRGGIKIFMFANVIDLYCPYFEEMGLDRVRRQQPGTIEIYQVGETGLKIALEYCADTKNAQRSKVASDVYFCFNNPKLKMITQGDWEMDVYPHLPYKYKSTEIVFMFFIIFKEDVLQAEVITHGNSSFIYIHKKTGAIREPDTDLVYTLDYDPRPNWRRCLNKPMLPVERRIWSMFLADKVFYQDNITGEIVSNYLQLCQE